MIATKRMLLVASLTFVAVMLVDSRPLSSVGGCPLESRAARARRSGQAPGAACLAALVTIL